MSENEQKTAGQTGEKPAIERALEAFEQAKAAVRDANAHLITLAAELRNVLRDQKAQSADLDKARGTLAKLQSMSL
jgi:exonuclease VII small subunit